MSEETVTLTIDGREITVPKGTLLIRAAEELGNIIPRFCDHPLLDPVGACRQCIVDVEGQRKPMAACTTECGDGWVVKTQETSEMAAKAQEGVLEFLLINHPLDCPMCDKGGECPLQDQALKHGANESRFVDDKRRYDKPVAVSEQVLLDRERCVLCARCTRFSEQISGDPFIELFERGALEQVAIYEDEPYSSYFSGNVIQICPVGALTSKAYRFKARPFDLRSAPSVCDHCSAGCTLTVQSRRGDIQRQLARTNMPVNEAWNCDKGRFGYKYLSSDARLREPMVKKENEFVGVSWAEALTAATSAINSAGKGKVAVVTGGRLADEDVYAASKYARVILGTDDIDFRVAASGVGADVETLSAIAGRESASYADVEAAKLLIVVGLDTEEENPVLHLRVRKAWRKNRTKVVTVGTRAGSLAKYASHSVATATNGEVFALASLARALGQPSMAELAAAGGVSTDDRLVADVKAAGSDVVVIVGERAGAGALAAAGHLVDGLGAKLAFVPRKAGSRGALSAGAAAGLLPGGRRLSDADDRAAVAAIWGDEFPTKPGRDLDAILEAAAAGKIDVLHLIGVDLARDAKDPAVAKAALTKVKTVIVQDLAENDTTPFADVVLPAVATQERAGAYTNWEGRTQRFTPAIAAPKQTQADWEILVQLAALQGMDLGFHDLDGIRNEMERVGRRDAAHALPSPTPAEAATGEGLALTTYPLLLDDGVMTRGADDLLATARPAYVSMNPADAAAADLVEGALVQVTGSTADGEVVLTLPLVLDATAAPGHVFVPSNSTEKPANALGSHVAVGAGPVPESEAADAEVTA